MNTAVITPGNVTLDSLAAQILLSALTTAQRLNAGDTLLFLEAYDKICAIERTGSNVIKFTPQMPSKYTDDEILALNGMTPVAAVEKVAIVSAEPALPDLGEPTPIQPIPAPTKRNRRTQAQIEADNAAAAAAPPRTEVVVQHQDGLDRTLSVATSEPAASAESAAPPEGIDGITLSTLFKTILSSKEEPDKTTFKNAVRSKLEEVGIPQISKLTPEHFESFNTFLLSFKA